MSSFSGTFRLTKFSFLAHFSCRFIRQQSRVDNFTIGTRIAIGHRWLIEFRQVGTRTSLSDRIVHARGIAGRWPLQKRDFHRQSKLFIINSRRRRASRDAGMLMTKLKKKRNKTKPNNCKPWSEEKIDDFNGIEFFVRLTSQSLSQSNTCIFKLKIVVMQSMQTQAAHPHTKCISHCFRVKWQKPISEYTNDSVNTALHNQVAAGERGGTRSEK